MYLSNYFMKNCFCSKSACHCCYDLDNKQKISKLCVNYKFSGKTEDSSVSVSLGSDILEHRTSRTWDSITPICLNGMGLNGCLQLNSVRRSNAGVNVCFDAYLKHKSEEIFQMSLGCLDAQTIN